MKNDEVSDQPEEKSEIGKHLLIFFLALVMGYTIGYFISTENSKLYGVVTAWISLEFWALIDATLNS